VESGAYDIQVGASSGDIRRHATLQVRSETIPARDLSKQTRAVDFDDYSAVQLVDESKARGDAVGGSAGSWVKFAAADLGSGTSRFTAQASKASAGDGSVQIRLDSPTGRVVGTTTVASTGNVYTYAPVTAALTGARGRHDVYLVFGGDLRLSTFALTK
jgi:beta-glucosidase